MSASVSELGLDDSLDKHDFPSRYSYSQAPFTGWGYVQLLSSALYPSKYEIRPIGDRGALCDSIRNSNIDLFDRVSKKEFAMVKLARMVGIVASFLFINLMLAPIGAVYHLADGLKNAILIIFRSGKRGHHFEETVRHLYFAVVDGIHCGIPFAVGAAVAPTGVGLLLTIGAVAATSLGLGLYSGALLNLKETTCTYMPNKKDQYGFYKSMRLREEFGIVDRKTGNLLNWDPQKDADIATYPTGFGLGLGYKLNGYFVDLHKGRAEEFLNTIHELQTALPADHKIPFSYPPKAETILAFLAGAPTGLSNLEEWEKKLRTQEADMKVIWDIMSRGFTLSSREVSRENHGTYTVTTTTTHTLPDRFPLDQDACRKYFQP